jgi:uncharacterized membrane protein
MNTNKSLITRIFNEIGTLFFSGLFTILPLAITLALFAFTLRIVHGWSRHIYCFMPPSLQLIPYADVFIFVLLILVIGAILKYLLLHPLVEFIEKHLFGNIPLVRQVYFGIKQLVSVMSPKEDVAVQFQQVVLVEFPRPGIFCIGLVTGITPPAMIPGVTEAKTYYNVFVPTTPNPTTGFFFVVSETECRPTRLTRQEAMALVISGGIIQPDRFTMQ